MPKDYPRSLRIADQIQRDLSDIIRLELKDPRIGMITVTGVVVSRDCKHAKVYFTQLTEGDFRQALDGLQHAAGFLRTQLAHRMKLRLMPGLQFVYDESVERGMHLSQLIDNALADDSHRHDDGTEK
jgi:ribosome-binding factor A